MFGEIPKYQLKNVAIIAMLVDCCSPSFLKTSLNLFIDSFVQQIFTINYYVSSTLTEMKILEQHEGKPCSCGGYISVEKTQMLKSIHTTSM